MHPHRWYTAPELEQLLGRKLADECVPLATTRGRYFGKTIIRYLDELGKRQVAQLVGPKSTIDRHANTREGKTHVAKNHNQSRHRLYQDTEP